MPALYFGRLKTSESQSGSASRVAMQRDDRVFTLFTPIAVCLHIVRLHICMLWLGKIMQKPAAARRALAVELLRRLDHTKKRRHRSHSLPALRPRFADELQSGQQQSSMDCRPQLYRAESPRPQLRLLRQRALGTTKDGSALVQLAMDRSLNIPSPRDVPTDSRGIVQMDKRSKHHEQETAASQRAELTPPVSPLLKARPVNRTHDVRESTPELKERFSDSLLQFGVRCTPPTSDHGASDSDTRSTKGDGSQSPKTCKPIVNAIDDTVGGADENDVQSPDRTLVNTNYVFGSPATTQDHMHRQSSSINSTSTVLRKSSVVTLRAQNRNEGGLLELRASATKPHDPTPTSVHRRNTTINLPIRVSAPQPEDSQQSQAPSPASDELDKAARAELELQYKYRHIFVGTASLHNFLDTLETSLGTTTKLAVMKAFTILASNEQLLYRQSSTNPKDWNLVTRIMPDTSDFNCVTMARVLLGSISLQQFVDSIPFDVFDEAPTDTTVEAFKNASHMDAGEDRSGESKARASRAWLLSQKTSVE